MKYTLAAFFLMAGSAMVQAKIHTQVIEYKQGTYQGKPDQPPYAVAPWNGNKTEWDVAIRTRNQNQNEYKRTN